MSKASFQQWSRDCFTFQDRVETLVLDPRPRRRRDQATRHKKRSKRKQDTSNVDEDRMAADCEMITSL